MSFVDEQNCYHRTTIVIDKFDDGKSELVKSETVYMHPPCSSGCGCRAAHPDQEHCETRSQDGTLRGTDAVTVIELTTEEQQEIDDRKARAQLLGDLEYVKGHAGLDTFTEDSE